MYCIRQSIGIGTQIILINSFTLIYYTLYYTLCEVFMIFIIPESHCSKQMFRNRLITFEFISTQLWKSLIQYSARTCTCTPYIPRAPASIECSSQISLFFTEQCSQISCTVHNDWLKVISVLIGNYWSVQFCIRVFSTFGHFSECSAVIEFPSNSR